MASCNDFIIESDIGRLRVSTHDQRVTKIEWHESPDILPKLPTTPLDQRVHQQLSDYFLHAHNDWTLDLVESGTEFQQKVWHYLRTIPLGETRYYSDVAKVLNSSAQAVGNACRANPFVIVTPCHRVIAKTGLGGYDGQTSGRNLTIKQWLLDHERK